MARNYKGRTFIRERLHICGDFMDAEIYPVFQAPGKRRKKCCPTSEVQAKLNQRNAERRAIRMIHANFGEGDLEVALSYDDDALPENVEAAKKEMARFMRKLRALYKSRGLTLKYMSSPPEEGKISKRFNHHVIFSGGVDRDEIEKLWHNGYANCRRLQMRKEGLAGITCYTMKSRLAYRRYNCSRNLARPEPVEYDGRMDRAEQQRLAEMVENGTIYAEMERVYPDYECIEAEAVRNEINGCIYIRIFMRRKTPELKQKRKEARKRRKNMTPE